MRINTKIRYGLRLLVNLAVNEKVVSTKELGKKMLVSPKYLRKLAGPLEKSHLVKSVQGIYGGYTLKKKPEDITLEMIFTAFQENFNITKCLDKKHCPLSKDCLTRPLWEYFEEFIKNNFLQISLNEIINQTLKK